MKNLADVLRDEAEKTEDIIVFDAVRDNNAKGIEATELLEMIKKMI